MTATIIESFVLKHLNQTMTVVEFHAIEGEPPRGRVIFADSFGGVRTTRTFRSLTEMYQYVVVQHELEADWRRKNEETGS